MTIEYEPVLRCDLDPEPRRVVKGTRTYRLQVGSGQDLEIELCPKHGAAFEKIARRYTTAARQVREPARGRRTTAQRHEARRIRDWAAEAGLTVSDRGRIPADVVAKYDTAKGRRGPRRPRLAVASGQ